MNKSHKSTNPFYVLLVLIGIAFFITATAFGVMTSRANSAPDGGSAEHPLMSWMDQHGMAALGVELALLAACTVGAIGTDEYWQRRTAARNDSPPQH